MAKKEQKQDMYVGLQSPQELRRSILLGTKQAIIFLKKYENLREITIEKDAAFVKLLTIMKQLNTAVGRLKTFFPRSKIHELEPPKQKVAAKHSDEKPVQGEHQHLKKTNKDLYKLESDLSQIEAKLAGL